MQEKEARELIKNTLEQSFDRAHFVSLTRNILHHAKDAPFSHPATSVYESHIDRCERVFEYKDADDKHIEVLIVYLKKETSLERARSMQRNFVSTYLNKTFIDAALVAFVAPNKDWRFSFVKMEYERDEQGKIKEKFTPARRSSFLVGRDEKSHTAQSHLLPILCKKEAPTLKELEDIFSVEQVTKEFFEKYESLFLRLKKELDSIVEKAPQIANEFNSKGINIMDFTKKLMGQVVFLYFLQKKGWFGVQRGELWGSGSKDFLRDRFEQAEAKRNSFFKSVLEPLFYEALSTERSDDYYSPFDCRIPFLNGGLFEPINDYNWVNLDLLLPNDLFSNKNKTAEGDTGDGVLDVFDRYNFTVKEDEPLEKEVAVDPEMLGKVFESLLDQRERKAKGAFYTPREVVHYMCQESLIHYLDTALEGRVSKEDVWQWVKNADRGVSNDGSSADAVDQLPQSLRAEAALLDQKLKDVRVCDPAVGSGAFVVGMMHEIVRLRNALRSDERTDEQVLYGFKRHAIEYCLYGVDIDSGAIEIARLRLWLSLVVDEQKRSTVLPLPNLDYKIVKGDALLSIQRDLWNNNAVEDLVCEQKALFNETSARKKKDHRAKIARLLSEIGGEGKTFYIELYFAEVFHRKQSFDIVIGNPPYIQLQKDGGALGKRYQDAGYESFARTGDIYQLFYERGHKLLAARGHLCFITSNKWMRAGYGQKMRNYFVERTQPLQLIDLGPGVFTATVDSNILLFAKMPGVFTATVDSNILLFGKKPRRAAMKAATLLDKAQLRDHSASALQPLPAPKKDEPWTILSPAEASLKQKIDKIGTPLKAWDVSIYRGVVTGYNDAFIIDTATKERLCREDPKSAEILKPVLRGKDIKRYHHQWAGLWLITTFPALKINIDDYPAVSAHLLGFGKQRLEQTGKSYNGIKARKKTHNKWFETSDQIAYYPDFEKEKIIYPNMVTTPSFLYDNKGYYTNQKCFILTGKRLRYLCGTFSSAVAIHWIKENCPKLGKDGRELSKIFFENIPIPPVTDVNRLLVEEIEAAVDIILVAKEADPKADTNAQEQRIDELVYQLYQLTEKEIATIEGP